MTSWHVLHAFSKHIFDGRLTKSDALCQSAQQWADHLLQKSEESSSNLLVHSSDAERQGAGENLYYLSREETMTLGKRKKNMFSHWWCDEA